jgi:hypothetical protein
MKPSSLSGANQVTVDVKGLARLCVDPFAIDKGLLFEQRRVVEL